MGSDMTISTLVVNMVEAQAVPAALFTSALLLAISTTILLAFKYLMR
jgi:ABC-type sulfate transport system permease component